MRMKPKSPWLVCHKSVPRPQIRLFCFPYAGAGASIFRRWTALLPDWVEMVAIQPPGREGRFVEPLPNNVREMASAIASAIAPWLDLPYAIFGHSLGTLVGFQTAVELRQLGMPQPKVIIMSGRGAPHLLHQRCDRYLLPHDRFVEEVRKMQGTPEEVLASEEMMELLVPMLRADFALNATYDAGEPPAFDCPLFAYGGSGDPEVLEDDLAQWQQYSSQATRIRMFDGGHFFVETVREQVLQQLAQDLAGSLR
jgi:medium-chain acyl-[acyl-carrier-protein] hydrolase